MIMSRLVCQSRVMKLTDRMSLLLPFTLMDELIHVQSSIGTVLLTTLFM